MITGHFYLKNYANWQVSYFLLVNTSDTEQILRALNSLQCNSAFRRRAKKLLLSGSPNIGLAYSNKRHKQSIIVVSEATSVWEFLNSFAHEIDHLEKHITKTLKFSPYSEAASYAVGEIVMNIFYKIFNTRVCKSEMYYQGR